MLTPCPRVGRAYVIKKWLCKGLWPDERGESERASKLASLINVTLRSPINNDIQTH